MKSFVIQGRPVGPGHPAFLVAELSANHAQRIGTARELIHAAKDAGADAVKLQTYTADTMTIDCHADPFIIKGTIWEGRRLYDLYREASTPWEWHGQLKELAEALGLAFFSTPFDATAVDFLEGLDVPAYKVASFELVDIPLLERIGATKKPVVLSTGMASREEIREAVDTLRAAGAGEVLLLHCVSAYPCPAEGMRLGAIGELRALFGPLVGLSDHSLGHEAAIAATALGAVAIEKHLTLSRRAPGPDSAFSLEPHEFADMVRAVRRTEAALRGGLDRPVEEDAGRAFRRSLFAVKDIRSGEPFTADNIRVIRPAHGLHPRHLKDVLRKTATTDIARGTPLAVGHIHDFKPQGSGS